VQVSELMSSSVISVKPEDTAQTAARLLSRHNLGSMPVLSPEGKLRGIVTDRDIVLRCVAAEEDPEATTVKEIMTRGVACVAPEDDVREAARVMAEKKVRRLPVVNNGRVVGMLSLGDLARSKMFDMEASRALTDISENIKRM
jgi:CBS domain-containing protein